MRMRKIVLLSLLLLFHYLLVAQAPFSAPHYPQGEFRNPTDLSISLAGNFGDLRANHYHMGLDIRTNGKENQNVYAAAEGYVSRIVIMAAGYGRAIYITHPNGYVTLYAHLNNFFDALHQYVVREQYKTQSWEQDIDFKPDQFPVRKGQFIAFSGNTGGSEGPHLHFEIRDAKTGNNLNPLLFGFDIDDDVPPALYRIGVYDRRISTLEQSPVQIALNKDKSGIHRIKDTVLLVPPKFSLAMGMEDKTNNSFKFGVYQAELYVDDQLKSAFRLDNFSYPDSRYIYAGTDSKLRVNGGPWMQHLSCLPGNQSPIYAVIPGDGVLELKDDLKHTVRVIVKDCHGNNSTAVFTVRRNPWQAAASTGYGYTFHPQNAASYKTDLIELSLPKAALYDSIWFLCDTLPAKYATAFSPMFMVHREEIQLHGYYNLKIKCAVPDSLKDKAVMVLQARRGKIAKKAKWIDSNWVESEYRTFGFAYVDVDTVPPVINPRNIKENDKFKKSNYIIVQCDDALGELTSFKLFIDGQWVLPVQKGTTYRYTFDEYCPIGQHELKIEAIDQSNNIASKIIRFNRMQ
jgi:hypothetical protein